MTLTACFDKLSGIVEINRHYLFHIACVIPLMQTGSHSRITLIRQMLELLRIENASLKGRLYIGAHVFTDPFRQSGIEDSQWPCDKKHSKKEVLDPHSLAG